MALLVRNIPLALDEPEEMLARVAARRLKLPVEAIRSYAPVRRSLDARNERDIHFVYHLELTLHGGAKAETSLLKRLNLPNVTGLNHPPGPEPQPGNQPLPQRPVVIGFGPAGMFAALELAGLGYCPLVYERGRDVTRRHYDVLKKYYLDGVFDPTSNLLFGEGGAGTYSDGKLYTRISDTLVRRVLETLHEHGADKRILVDAKPHVGSDKLPTICRRLRLHIERLGGEVQFESAMSDLRIEDGVLTALKVNGTWQTAGPVILAVGHSARDTIRMLADRGVALEAKPFQMGVRIEHPQAMVNRWQYGSLAGHTRLPPAEYQLVARAAGGDLGDLFSFCMCPGGMILPCNESPGQISTNGESRANRSGEFANGGLVVTIPPELVGGDPLQGLAYQERWERLAFELTGQTYRVPAQRAADFLKGRMSDGHLETSYPLGAQWAQIREVIPNEVTEALKRGLRVLTRRLRGFAGKNAIIVAPETRASAPVRIVRDGHTRQATRTANLYPVGEGAGYAGGIMSSAVDGIRTARAIIET
ncbi:MAG: NAD(P)/FAD-dependent oxidoreductase, partial [Planctomycetota bacterium]